MNLERIIKNPLCQIRKRILLKLYKKLPNQILINDHVSLKKVLKKKRKKRHIKPSGRLKMAELLLPLNAEYMHR